MNEPSYTTNKLITNYYPTYKLNDTLSHYKNTNPIEHSRYSDTISNLPISFINNNDSIHNMNNNNNFPSILHSKDDSLQYPFTSNQFTYGNF